MSQTKNADVETKKGMVEVLGTKAIFLSRNHSVQPVNLMLPPGISTIYIKRLDKNHIQLMVPVKEITRLTDNSKKLKAAVEGEVAPADKKTDILEAGK